MASADHIWLVKAVCQWLEISLSDTILGKVYVEWCSSRGESDRRSAEQQSAKAGGLLSGEEIFFFHLKLST